MMDVCPARAAVWQSADMPGDLVAIPDAIRHRPSPMVAQPVRAGSPGPPPGPAAVRTRTDIAEAVALLRVAVQDGPSMGSTPSNGVGRSDDDPA